MHRYKVMASLDVHHLEDDRVTTEESELTRIPLDMEEADAIRTARNNTIAYYKRSGKNVEENENDFIVHFDDIDYRFYDFRAVQVYDNGVLRKLRKFNDYMRDKLIEAAKK